MDMDLEDGEIVIEIEYDHTGLLVRTNFHLFLLHFSSVDVTKENIDLSAVDVLLDEVQKIRLRHVPIIYLRNGKVLLYSTKTQYCGTSQINHSSMYQLNMINILDY